MSAEDAAMAAMASSLPKESRGQSERISAAAHTSRETKAQAEKEEKPRSTKLGGRNARLAAEASQAEQSSASKVRAQRRAEEEAAAAAAVEVEETAEEAAQAQEEEAKASAPGVHASLTSTLLAARNMCTDGSVRLCSVDGVGCRRSSSTCSARRRRC
jgi:hypothetical protein